MTVDADAVFARDAELAAKLAYHAGRILLAVRASRLFAPAALGRAGDQTSHQFLMHALRDRRPGDAVLSEESKDTLDRLSHSRVWIIDPVDGTREFGEERSDWAVHVALAVNGMPAAAAVALPDLGGCTVLRTDRPADVPASHGPLRMVVSRTRPASEAAAVAGRLGAVLCPMGSAGAKAMAVVRGEADIYLHSGGQYEWDSCAPAAVAIASGLHASRIDGAPLVYNQPNAYMPDLLICRKEIAAAVTEAVASVRHGGTATASRGRP